MYLHLFCSSQLWTLITQRAQNEDQHDYKFGVSKEPLTLAAHLSARTYIKTFYPLHVPQGLCKLICVIPPPPSIFIC